MNKSLYCITVILFSIGILSASATVQTFSVNKSSFNEGDSIILSGKVDLDPNIPSIILQIITPDGSGLAHIANVVPKNDGTFSKTIHAGGPTWPDDGEYTVKISYGGNLEKTIFYKKSNTQSTQSNTSQNDPQKKESEITENIVFVENPKMRILGYPSYDKSPQYYVDRYYNEPEYQSWFDSQFPEYSIDEVVGYRTTHIENFPSYDKSPQYYVDRYYNEPEYQSWFDSQFPGVSLYDVLGFSTIIPDWIKTYGKNWVKGEITDREFAVGLDFMLENQIIVIQNFDYSKNQSVYDIPPWFRNTVHWWTNDLISQQEFVNSIKYLIQEEIIVLD